MDAPPPASSSDSARSTPDAAAAARGAIPKSRSIGRLDALRSSLREVSRSSSLRLGRRKPDDPGKKAGKKKNKPKEAAGEAGASPEAKPGGRAASLVRKLSLGRYRSKQRKNKAVPEPAPAPRSLSTSPELSPGASRTDLSEEGEDAPSAGSAASADARLAPEGEDGGGPPPPAAASQWQRPERGPAAAAGPSPEATAVPQRQEQQPAEPAEPAEPMSQPQGPGRAASRSRILAVTAPAVRKQEIAAAPPPPPPPPAAPDTEPEEGDQFGDVDADEDSPPLSPRSASMAAPPSAAAAIAEARARLTHSLGSGDAGSPAGQQPAAGEKREHLYKILVIGELGTGKTSIIKRYVHQFFSQHYRATIGVDFALKVLNWDANTVIRLQLWDIAGQERFGNMTRVYYKEAVGAFIVFDVTRAGTFDAVVKWKQDLDAKVQLPDGSSIPCVLLANKCDQQKEGIVNSTAKMDEYCKEKGFSAWFETSAKENINIEEAARCLVTKILQNDRLIHNDIAKDNDKFALDGRVQREPKGKSCSC